MEYVTHGFDPVFDENTKILLLGTMPSPKSREQGFYYGHPQNRMWRVLCSVFETPLVKTTEEKKKFLLSHGIGMWDILKSCEIQGASDSSIQKEIPNDFDFILKKADIQEIFTTGRKAFQLYQKYLEQKTGIVAGYLPSTSPANCGHYDLDTLIECYKKVLKKEDDTIK